MPFNGIKMFNKAPTCPLCHREMVRAYDSIRSIHVWACHVDKIAINVTDPFVGKWNRAHEKIECPNCTAAMRLFFTMTGFVLAKCPKCKCTIKETNPDRLLNIPRGDPNAATGMALTTDKALDLGAELTKEIEKKEPEK